MTPDRSTRRAVRRRLGYGGVVLVVAALRGAAGVPAESPRTMVVVEWSCVSEISERTVTVFANGTVRLRERLGERSRLRLAEVEAERVRFLVRLLAGEDLREAHEQPGIVRGEWVSRCGLDLRLRPGLPNRFTYSELDLLPLSLSRVLQHIEGFLVDLELRDLSSLPLDFEPQVGDVLRSAEGTIFKVIAFTADHRAIEIQARDQPITEYLAIEAVEDRFVELISRRGQR